MMVSKKIVLLCTNNTLLIGGMVILVDGIHSVHA